ncbi:MAG: prolipoprotein diacylglyceryl transferase [Paludibacteraceae bacterium]|nr:prolipoprotein diacylglyceryl transferase [Paludibacteraceae bacterium]
MLSVITWNVDPVAFSVGNLEVRWYGILWAVGIFLCLLIIQRLYKHEQCPEEFGDKIFIYGLLGVIIGARLGHCWFYEWHELEEPVTILGITFKYGNPYFTHPMELLKVWQGGLSSHGGACGLLIAMWLYDRRVTHRGFVWGLDHLVVGVCITGALIRLGNLMNSEIYGGPTDLPWGFIFVRDHQTVPCHPTQIYEMLYCLVTFCVLWYLYWKHQAYRRVGLIYGVFLEGIFLTRFLLEFIKNDQEAFEADMVLNMGQILSIPFIIWGFYSIYVSLKNPPAPDDALAHAEPQLNHQQRKQQRREGSK